MPSQRTAPRTRSTRLRSWKRLRSPATRVLQQPVRRTVCRKRAKVQPRAVPPRQVCLGMRNWSLGQKLLPLSTQPQAQAWQPRPLPCQQLPAWWSTLRRVALTARGWNQSGRMPSNSGIQWQAEASSGSRRSAMATGGRRAATLTSAGGRAFTGSQPSSSTEAPATAAAFSTGTGRRGSWLTLFGVRPKELGSRPRRQVWRRQHRYPLQRWRRHRRGLCRQQCRP
mmetsp:Transcript_57220/g.179686  ORF Transcript_57220/g.179686 Transcript_57220/m.179686 type:complete len:225 (+) Transcript_57220:586-1260(+)